VGLGQLGGAALRLTRGQGQALGVPRRAEHGVVRVEAPLLPRRKFDAGLGAVGQLGADQPPERVVVQHGRHAVLDQLRFILEA